MKTKRPKHRIGIKQLTQHERVIQRRAWRLEMNMAEYQAKYPAGYQSLSNSHSQ